MTSQDSKAINKKPRAILFFVLAILLVASLFVRYSIWQKHSRIQDRLRELRTQNEQLETEINQSRELVRQSDEIRVKLRKNKRIVEGALRSFRRVSLTEKLMGNLKLPDDIGVINAYVLNNKMHLTKDVLSVPGPGQTLVGFLKAYDLDAKVGMEILTSPDHFFEVPLPDNQLSELELGLVETPECEFVFRFGDKTQEVPMPGWDPTGYSRYGVDDPFAPPNFFKVRGPFWSGKQKELSQICFEKGIWRFAAIRKYMLVRKEQDKSNGEPNDDSETGKKLVLVVGLKSSGPFYADVGSEPYMEMHFDLTWDETKSAFLLTQKK